MNKRLTADEKLNLIDEELSLEISSDKYTKTSLLTFRKRLYNISTFDLSKKNVLKKNELLLVIKGLLKETN